MLYYALVFLIVGLIVAAPGTIGAAAVATHISSGLFLIGIVLLVIHIIVRAQASSTTWEVPGAKSEFLQRPEKVARPW